MFSFKHGEISASEGAGILNLDIQEFKRHFITFIQNEAKKQRKVFIKPVKDEFFVV
jgi:hypothetical protein